MLCKLYMYFYENCAKSVIDVCHNHVHWFSVLGSRKLWSCIYLSDKSFVQNAQAADPRLSLNSLYWQVYFISFGSFNDTKYLRLYSIEWSMISEQWTGQDVEGCHGLIWGISHLSGRSTFMKTLNQDCQSLSWDLNIVHTKREAGMLDTQPWHFWLTFQDDCQQISLFVLSPEGLPLGAVWSFNRQIWQCWPIKYTSLSSKRENVPQWEFKLNGVTATAYTLHFTGSVWKLTYFTHYNSTARILKCTIFRITEWSK